MSSSRRLVHKLHEFLKMQGRVEAAPGFSSALGLDFETLTKKKDSVTVTQDKVTLRYPANTPQRFLPDASTISLSTYMAIMDDVTTWALVLGDKQRARPGKSVSMSMWIANDVASHSNNDDIMLSSEVTVVAHVQKIGRNLGFCNAHVAKSGGNENLVCFGSHVKYLPMGPLFDMALSSYGWKAATLYSDYMLSDPPPTQVVLTDLFDSLKFVDDSTATFHVEPIHASLGGPIHGGCQAVLMELVATHVAKQQLDTCQVILDSIHVEYKSPPSSKMVTLKTSILSRSSYVGESTLTLLVRLVGSDDKIKSEGVLRFSAGGT